MAAGAGTQTGSAGRCILPVAQQQTQDCGFCCVCSVIHALSSSRGCPESDASNDPQQVYTSLSQKFPHLLCGASTVELAEPLMANGISNLVFSTQIQGLNPKHADLPFYKDIDCTQEDARLKTKTAELQSQGLVVDSKCLSIDEICELAAGPAVCIVLVDSRFLPHVSLFVSLQPTYVGHFILVFDYSYEHNEVLFMDPAGGGSIETCSPEVLQVARDQQGTDLDVLCIPLPQYEATPDERAAD